MARALRRQPKSIRHVKRTPSSPRLLKGCCMLFLPRASLLVEFEELVQQPVCFSIFTSYGYKTIFYPLWELVSWVREASF